MMVVVGIVLVLLAGAAVKFGADRWGEGYAITAREFAVGAVVCSLVVVPLVVVVGTKVAKGNQLKYNEFWGGFERAATKDVTPCDRDGPCVHEYDCDPYTVTETYTESEYAGTDAKGNAQYRTVTKTREVTKYHACPYATEEWTFRVETDFDGYTVVDHGFADEPREWRGGHGIPGDVFRGTPQEWIDSKAAIEAGTPFGVTTRHKYDNYILASQNSILKTYADDVDTYAAKGWLPDMAKSTDGRQRAQKFHAVKMKADTAAWDAALGRFNGYLGTKRQGDLHVVAVSSRAVIRPDDYAGALNAYWTGKRFSRNALSKNGVVLVLGVTGGGNVEWARMFTGMPVGNERVATEVRSALKDVPFTPEAVLGTATPSSPGDGAFAKVVLGDPGFVRICMTCNDKGETGGGFSYLNSEIQPTRGQKTVIYLVALLLSLAVWGALVAVGFNPVDARPRRSVY